MDYSSLTPLIISMISLFISLYAARKAWRFNEISLRTQTRNEHLRWLLEIDQNVIDTPELWGIYDSHPCAEIKASDRLMQAKREAFIYLHFNLFNLMFDIYEKYAISNDKYDIAHWRAFRRYIFQFFRESSGARNLFKQARTQEIYTKDFVSFINDEIIGKIEKGEPLEETACA